jgi:hypothetical protein
MRQLMLRRWLGGSVCAAVLMAGCNQAQRQPAYSSRPIGSVAMLPGYTPGTVFSSTPMQTQAAKPAAVATMPTPAPEAQPDKVKQVTELLPPVTPTPAPAPTKDVEPIPTVAKNTDSEATPAAYAVPLSGGKDEPFHRRAYVDITAKSCFAHASDYSWLQGELTYLHSRNCWRIRYASVDEDDKYGGGVYLTETGPMDNFKDGQLVRIEGRPADMDNKDSEYRVNAIHPLPDQQ